ncbi:MAG: PAS domain-containing protein, partial [Chloroflexota bacterium]
MTVEQDRFAKEIEALLSRVEALYARSVSPDSADDDLLKQAIAGLYEMVEELQVASEELRQQNEELAEANHTIEVERRRYRDLFEMAPDGYLVTNLQGVIIEANQAAADMLNVPKDKIASKPLVVYVSQDNNTEFLTLLTGLKQGNPSASIELKMSPRHRPFFDADLRVASATPTTSSGSPYLLWLLRDVSVIKEAQRSLSQANEQLESRVEERTAELITTGETLKKANAEMKEFVFVASHDLQEPLRKIQAFGERISSAKGDQLDDEGRDYLDRMVNAAARMQEMVASLLDYSRITTRAQPFSRVNLNEATGEALSN